MTSAISSPAIDALKAELASTFPDVRFVIRLRFTRSSKRYAYAYDVMYKDATVSVDDVEKVVDEYEDELGGYVYVINLADGEE